MLLLFRVRYMETQVAFVSIQPRTGKDLREDWMDHTFSHVELPKRFLLVCFSSLSMSLWIAVRCSSISTTSPSFGLSADLLREHCPII